MLNKKSLVGALATLVLVPTVLVGCSSGSGTPSEPTPGAQSARPAELATKINACLREKGYDVDDGAVSEGSAALSVPEGADPERYLADQAACAERVNPGAGSGQAEGSAPSAPSAQEQQAVGACMRENGFPDYSDGDGAEQHAGAAGFDETFERCTSDAGSRGAGE